MESSFSLFLLWNEPHKWFIVGGAPVRLFVRVRNTLFPAPMHNSSETTLFSFFLSVVHPAFGYTTLKSQLTGLLGFGGCDAPLYYTKISA